MPPKTSTSNNFTLNKLASSLLKTILTKKTRMVTVGMDKLTSYANQMPSATPIKVVFGNTNPIIHLGTAGDTNTGTACVVTGVVAE